MGPLHPSNSATIRAQFPSRSIVVLLVRCGENANYLQGEIFNFCLTTVVQSRTEFVTYVCVLGDWECTEGITKAGALVNTCRSSYIVVTIVLC